MNKMAVRKKKKKPSENISQNGSGVLARRCLCRELFAAALRGGN